jgi:uncharacterized YigZ family protein
LKDFSFTTITTSTEGLYKEKGSKFIAHAVMVGDEQAVKTQLENFRKQYYDARHHCYAFIINKEGRQYERANDDGEPNHSAGDPILGQIKSFGLSNVLIVVVRYFGGTKLGVSGLITAYKTAAEEALKLAKIKLVTLKQEFSLTYPYDQTSDVQRLISDFEVEIKDQQYLENCKLIGKLIPSKMEEFKKKIYLIGGVEIDIQ